MEKTVSSAVSHCCSRDMWSYRAKYIKPSLPLSLIFLLCFNSVISVLNRGADYFQGGFRMTDNIKWDEMSNKILIRNYK